MIAEVKQILQSREEALCKVEESHKVLQNEQIMKQSELEVCTLYPWQHCMCTISMAAWHVYVYHLHDSMPYVYLFHGGMLYVYLFHGGMLFT